MSYDLMVFAADAAPRERGAFLDWYQEHVQWGEDHSYDDPEAATPELQAWFSEMIQEFPPLNGPLATHDFDNPRLTDYSIGRNVIYAAFGWPQAEAARQAVVTAAKRHAVGFFDVSSDDGSIVFPGDMDVAGESSQGSRKPWWRLW